jgi:eukaryotic-like serine/threonine-protein kinase
VVPTLESQVKAVSMVLATVPQDAEVKVNGKIVRAQGSQDSFIKDLPASEEMAIEVHAPGFKAFQQKYAPPTSSEPLQVTVRLEPAELAVQVESEPAGATILASGKELGRVTPALVKLPAGVKQVTLRLKCFEDAELPVNPPTSGESPAVVKGALKKQPGCK